MTLKLPTGVTTDKERGKFRATYKGYSVRCNTLESAIAERHRLRGLGVAHPSYIARKKAKGPRP